MQSKSAINKKTPYYPIIFIIIVDIFLLPVSPLYSLPYSFFIFIFLFPFSKVDIPEKNIIYVLIGLLTSSLLFSFLFASSTASYENSVIGSAAINVHKEEIRRFIELMLSMIIFKVLYKAFTNNFVIMSSYMKRIVRYSIISIVIIFIIFSFSQNAYFALRNIMFQSDVNVSSSEAVVASGYLARFSYIFLDPNNACYTIMAICLFGLNTLDYDNVTRALLNFVLILVPVVTMSTGGIYCLIAYSVYVLIKRKGVITVSKKRILIFFIVVFIISSVLLFVPALKNTLSKFFQKAYQRWSTNKASFRLDRYRAITNTGFPKLIGYGYSIVYNGIMFSPHSDHLRFIYGYGVITYIVLIILFAKKEYLNRAYSFILPCFVAFSINSLIDEPRMLYIFIIMFAFARAHRLQQYEPKPKLELI